jgi:zinc protease
MSRTLLFCTVALCTTVARADEAPKKVASVEGVTEYRLANGARVLLFPEASRPTVTVNMTVLVGSRHEGYGETGMAHLLEHMVFKGTPTFADVPKALRDHGAQFNGTTNDDRTNYFETLPANDANLEFAIKLESDRLVHSFVKREDLASEMTVVRNEFERGENDPRGVLFQRIAAAAYEWHNYGKSTIGNRSDIERVPIENLQAFYRKYYQPDNVVLIITGKFEEPKALALAEKYLGSIPKPARKLDNTYTEEPAQDGERLVTLRRVGKVASVGVAYHIPSAGHPDWAPLDLLADVLSQQPNGRLYRALVESKKATSVFSNAGNDHDPGLLTAMADAEPGKLDTVRDTLLDTIEGVAATPLTDMEVEQAKVRNRTTFERLLSNSGSMSQALSSASARGDWRLLFLQRDRLEAATAADVNRVARTYLQRSNRTVGIYVPEDKPQRLAISAAPPLETVVKDYKGGKAMSAGEAFDPTPENLDAKTKIVDVGDGIKAGLITKKNRGESVSLVLTLHYGNEDSLRGETTAAGILPRLMMSGTKKHDRQALREELDKLGVRIVPGTGGFGGRGGRGGSGGAGTPGQLSFFVEAKRSTLLPALKLLGEILREPSFPAEEFDTLRRQMLADTKRNRPEPLAIAGNHLSRALAPYSPNDVRYVPTLEENEKRLESLTLPQVAALYDKQVGATEGQIGIVGDFDAEPTIAALRDILKGWKSTVPVRRIAREAPANFAGSKEVIITPDKENAVFMAGLAFRMKETDPDYAALRLGNYLFGGSTLSSRLGDRIRQKDGLTYGVVSQLAASARDPYSSFVVLATMKPENVDKVEKAFAEELARFQSSGPAPGELNDARKGYLESLKVSRTSDAAIAGDIAANIYLGRTFAFMADMEKRIAALTPEEVRLAFQKHIDPNKLAIFRAGDFKR